MATMDRELEAYGLGVQLEQQGERVAVRAWGELDLSSAKELEAEVSQAIKGSSRVVILDLGGVTFIDSTGLGVLLSMAALSRARRRKLIVRESEQVKYVVETSGLRDLMPLPD